MSAKKELALKVIAIIIIIIMTLADFAIVGMNAISYAIDMKITNSNNVEFCAYFVDNNKQQVTEINSNINSNDLKVYIEISVKNEGYFNGKISLENSSFRFNNKNTNENEFVKEIDESNITLNQINAGTTAKIELGIEFLNEDNIEFDSLGKDNKINLTGVYKNSKKDIDIQGNTTVKVNWKSQEELNAKIGAKILTNKVYEIEGSKKRIIQVLVDSKLENDLYPIKNTNIKLNVPQGLEKVKVHSRSTDATNGKAEFDEKNHHYNSETGILEINIQNEEKDGKISWQKNKKDSLVVTYIYPENMDLEKQEINIESVITTYDEKQVNANCKTVIEGDINGILTSSINLDETEIYKGKLYTAEERYYTTSTIINVNYALMDKVQIDEKQAVFGAKDETKQANIQYVQSKINKAEFEKILGENGYITIIDQDGNTIENINKDTDADDNGYININYNSGVKSITINTSKPQTEETLNIYHRKVILGSKYSKEEISKFTGIKEEIRNGYNANNVKTIELKNTESKASIEVSTDTLSVIKENKNIEMVATLETNDESKDLYKNPSVDIIFPKEITQVKILSAKALYRNGLTVAKCEKIKNKNGNTVLHIDFEGEQEKYNSEILKGLEIHIYADLIFDKTTPSKVAEFTMNYTNDNGSKDSYSVSKKINVESQDGLVLYNSISDYNKQDEKIEVIDEEQTIAKLDMNSKEKTAKVETALINNYDEDITENTVVIGKIPVKNNENTFNTEISNLTVSNKNAQVFYSKDINAKADDKSWSTKSTDAKLYKVVLDNMDSGEVVKISYDISIPAKLSYNEKGVLTTSLAYNYDEKDLSDSSDIVFETETAILKETTTGTTTVTDSGLEVNVVSVLGNKELKEGDSIYEGETIRYTVNIKNNSGNDLTNIQVKATQTNGLIFDLVEKEVYNPSIYDTEDAIGIEHFWEVTDTNIKEFEKLDIENGQSVILEFQVVVKKSEGIETYSEIVINSENNSFNEKIVTTKYDISAAELNLLFVPATSEECGWTSESVQQANLEIKNTSNNELKDIKVQITLSKELDCKYSDYIEYSSDIEVQINNKEVNNLEQTIITLQISKLNVGQTGYIYIKPYILDFKDKNSNVEFYASAMTDNNKMYSSNNIIRNVTRVRKDITVTQIAKINGEQINESTIANNNDDVEFNITIKNEDSENAKIYITDLIQVGLDVNSISLVNSLGEVTDITEQFNNNYLGYNITLNSGDEIKINVVAKINTLLLKESTYITNKIEVNEGTIIYYATVKFKVNVVMPDDDKLNIIVDQIATPQNKSIIKDGQKITYEASIKNICNYDRKINIIDYLNSSLKNIQVYIDDNDVTDKYLSDNDLKINDYTIKANTSINLKVKAKIDLTNYSQDTISNVILIKSKYPDYLSNTITYYTPEISGENPNNESYVIKGTAWIDSNKNGKREDDEERIKDLEIRAINTKTQEVLDTKVVTDEYGSYKLSLPQGKYIIVFMYNNDEYYITTYHADNVGEDINSDAISKELIIDNNKGTYGATDEINLTANKENIDIGLINRNKFDLKLDKYITKVVVTNKSGTKTYNFDKTDLGKVEIASKYLSGSTVLVEYTIKVTNVGDVAGSVEKIVDNMPSDMIFSSSLNKDWYQSGKDLFNESLADKILDKGESAEVKIILTKKMTDSNTGLFNNTASIKSFKNLDNKEDINPDNNKSSADLMISVKTGTVIKFSLLVFSLTVSIAAIVYYIVKRYVYR